MKKIYIAGPYTDHDLQKTQQYVNDAIAIGCKLLKKGYAPFIPHLCHYIRLHPDGDFDYETWMKYDSVWLRQCEAFYYLGPSPGADEEYEEAIKMRIPIYTDIKDVPDIPQTHEKHRK